MRVLFVSSEVYPLAKTGGLADVSGSLPAALAVLGLDMRLFMPAYPEALARLADVRVAAVLDDDGTSGPLRVLSAVMPDSAVPVWLLDCPRYFGRGGRLYTDEDGRDWPDNADRFALFSRIAVRLACGEVGLAWQADVVHANDWHAGLVPALLTTRPRPRPASVFTIHNMGFQGLFEADVFPALGLPAPAYAPDGVEFYGRVSFLKAGIRYAEEVTAVSPTYAREISSSALGFGLEGVLAERRDRLTGILNGVDYGVWDPAHDRHLPSRYDAANLANKATCKERLREAFGLDVRPETPIVAFLSRLTDQKMADVVLEALPWFDSADAQLVLVGEGEPALERAFAAAAAERAGRVAVHIGYAEPLAHRVLAGADILLAPARFEPCGLTQMYALRYGTVPVVRATGGLIDTVVDADALSVRRGTATGFLFEAPTVAAMTEALDRACQAYRQQALWRRLQHVGMEHDFGWARSALRYLAVYERPLGGSAWGIQRLRAGAAPLLQQEAE